MSTPARKSDSSQPTRMGYIRLTGGPNMAQLEPCMFATPDTTWSNFGKWLRSWRSEPLHLLRKQSQVCARNGELREVENKTTRALNCVAVSSPSRDVRSNKAGNRKSSSLLTSICTTFVLISRTCHLSLFHIMSLYRIKNNGNILHTV